jgi:hypothetical protein
MQDREECHETLIILPALVIAFVALSPVGVALADNPHTTPGSTGQPNKEASDDPALKPPGFSTSGFANAETHYAGKRRDAVTGPCQQPARREPIRRRRFPVGAAPLVSKALRVVSKALRAHPAGWLAPLGVSGRSRRGFQ